MRLKGRVAVITGAASGIGREIAIAMDVTNEAQVDDGMARVAEAALFFASFESNAMTGQSLVVSHGWFMQ